MVIETFSTKEITSIIKALKTKNSHEIDEIYIKLLKVSATYIHSPLTYPTNYSPMSLLTSFSKAFKKALRIRLTEHFNTNKLLVGNQFGFRKGTATEDVIFKLTNEILNASNHKATAGSNFCDLEKAFDSVNHDIYYCPNYRIIG